MHKKWTDRVELTKKNSHCKSRDFLRKRQLKDSDSIPKNGMAYSQQNTYGYETVLKGKYEHICNTYKWDETFQVKIS